MTQKAPWPSLWEPIAGLGLVLPNTPTKPTSALGTVLNNTQATNPFFFGIPETITELLLTRRSVNWRSGQFTQGLEKAFSFLVSFIWVFGHGDPDNVRNSSFQVWIEAVPGLQEVFEFDMVFILLYHFDLRCHWVGQTGLEHCMANNAVPICKTPERMNAWVCWKALCGMGS